MLGSARNIKGTAINTGWPSSLFMDLTSYQLQHIVLGPNNVDQKPTDGHLWVVGIYIGISVSLLCSPFPFSHFPFSLFCLNPNFPRISIKFS